MSEKKLKKMFVICIIILVILILIPSCSSKKNDDNDDYKEPTKQISDVKIGNVHDFEKIDYNNLTPEEMDYISGQYSGNAKFTKRGVEVYYESIFSGKLRKIITSTWPDADIGNFIPKPEYDNLNRIEYSEDWIEVYINDGKNKDVKNYLKQLKEYGFTENEEKDDGKVMLEYKIYNQSGDLASVKLLKGTNLLVIRAEKAQ